MISETGWFDDTIFKKNMADYGGNRTDAVPHSHAFLGNGDFVTF
ncbi:MAG: hypothetical protein ACM3Q0_03275 [Bacteroidota bacterium]